MSEWKTVRLGDVCEKGSSNIAQNEIADNNGEYPIYGAAGFIKNVDFYKQDKPYIGIVKDGAGVGRVSVHPAKSSLIGTMQYIFPKENIDIKFLAEFLKYQNLSRFYTGATIPHIYFKDYQNIPLKLPSLQKQKHISAVLGKCTELIVKNKTILEKYDTLIKSRFIEMFGDPDTNPKRWNIKTLNEVCRKITDGKHGGCKLDDKSDYYYVGAREIFDLSIHYETAQKITKEDFEKDYKRCNLEIGDFCIVNTGATIGKTAIAKDKRTTHTLLQKSVALLKVKPEEIIPIYLQYSYITNESMYKVESASAQPNLLLSKIRVTKLMVPPIAIQNDFAAFVQQIDKSKFAVQKSLEKAEILYKSLMQEYFG